MALVPQNDEAFIREVDDEVRREQAQALAQRYGLLVVVLVVLALGALAGTLWWRSHQQAVAGERGDQMMAAMSDISTAKEAEGKAKLDALAKTDTKGYAPLARLLEADLLVKDNKAKEAAAAFLKVAQDGSVPQPLRNAALVRATLLQFDDLEPQQVVDRLKPLAAPGNPWFGSAGEMSGLAYMKMGQDKQAGALFVAMSKDQGVPDTTRARVAQLAGSLGFDAVQPADSPAA